ncbi:unnamed protein product, partial [Discosporangium mesarthrocarpum]
MNRAVGGRGAAMTCAQSRGITGTPAGDADRNTPLDCQDLKAGLGDSKTGMDSRGKALAPDMGSLGAPGQQQQQQQQQELLQANINASVDDNRQFPHGHQNQPPKVSAALEQILSEASTAAVALTTSDQRVVWGGGGSNKHRIE